MRIRYVAAGCIVMIALAACLAMGAPTYVGVDKCKLCHKIQYESWAKTKHAKAFESLKPAEQSKTECVGCDVTGSKALPGVQCEACHGPGSDYRSMAVMKDKTKAVAAGLIIPKEADCVKCHNKKSPTFKGFNYAEEVKKVHAHKKA